MKIDVEFIEDDMRRFVRPNAFDAVINICTSFGYFEEEEENRRAARNIYQSLKPGGQVLFDMVGQEIIRSIYTRRDWRELDGNFLLEERVPSDDWSIMSSRYVLVTDGRIEEFNLDLHIYSAPEFTSLLADEGFTDIHTWGNLQGAAYDDKAKRMVTVARK
jgi:SAM-dependent methyltransferase